MIGLSLIAGIFTIGINLFSLQALQSRKVWNEVIYYVPLRKRIRNDWYDDKGNLHQGIKSEQADIEATIHNAVLPDSNTNLVDGSTNTFAEVLPMEASNNSTKGVLDQVRPVDEKRKDYRHRRRIAPSLDEQSQ